jgi:hypothetical protein
MNSENELTNSVELAKKLIKKREEVKRKMNLLKQGEIRQEGAFSPITKRLKTISITSELVENNPTNVSHYDEETLISKPSKRLNYTLVDLMNESVEQ